MSKNMIFNMFLGGSANSSKRKSKTPEKKIQKKLYKEDINKYQITAKDFYRKMNEHSSKKLAFQCLERSIKDPEIIRKKISKKKFLLGTNLYNKKSKRIKKKNNISRKEIKKKNLFEFKNTELKYEDIIDLNKIWEDYILEMIQNDKSELAILIKIGKSDFHGAKIKITFSKCPTLIGIEGIVLKENTYSFLIICKDNKIKRIIKNICVFSIFLKNKEIKIYGSILTKRIEERFKQKFNLKHIYKNSKDLINLI